MIKGLMLSCFLQLSISPCFHTFMFFYRSKVFFYRSKVFVVPNLVVCVTLFSL